MDRISAAVIGCGRMGAFTSESVKKYSPSCWFPLSHIEALQEINEVRLDAVCDINIDLLEKVKSSYSVQRSYTNYNKMLGEVCPQLVCVATRTIERTDIITSGIESGVKAFHVEKPICNSVEQLQQLEEQANKHNIAISYGALRRYFSVYQKAKELVDSGEFGDLQQIQVNFGKGQLFWTHPHSIDLVLFFSGNRKLVSVQSRLSNVAFGKTDDIIESDPVVEMAALYFDDDVVGTISKIDGMDVTLSCSKGIITVEADGRRIVCRRPGNHDPYFEFPGYQETWPIIDTEGTCSAISNLVKFFNTDNSAGIIDNPYSGNENIFLGQKALFMIVHSHINNGQVVGTKIEKNITVLGKTGENYA